LAKKTRSKAQAKAKAKPSLRSSTPVGVESPEVAATPKPTPPAAALRPELPKVMISPLELAALIVGIIVLVLGVVWAFIEARPPEAPLEVKNQSIPMTLDDFKGEPALQNVIQKQLDGYNQTSQTPQAQPDQSSQAIGNQLQSTATGLQP
jgi:hypothetical protein